MTHYKKKTIVGNRYSLNKLTEFRNLVDQYFKLAGPVFIHPSIIDHKGIASLRAKINKSIHSLCQIMIEADVIPEVMYTSSPIRDNVSEDIDLLNNIFTLHQYRIPPQQILDFIDRAIGVYSHDKISSIIRTLNPLFWFIRFLDFIFNIPFRLLKNSGFNIEKAENNFFVKLIKFIFYCVGFLASILTVLNLLGYLEKFRDIL